MESGLSREVPRQKATKFMGSAMRLSYSFKSSLVSHFLAMVRVTVSHWESGTSMTGEEQGTLSITPGFMIVTPFIVLGILLAAKRKKCYL